MNIKKYLVLFFFFSATLFFTFIYGCKKIDLVRVAAVNTESMDNITSNSAKAFASIIDLGIEEQVEDYGFCWSSINSSPTTSDFYYYFGISTNYFRNYDYIINGLQSSTIYYLRAFVKADGNISYGNTIKFETEPGNQPPISHWFHYDDGINDDGIGLTEGGSFDVAIRIPTNDLQSYNGCYISKFKFFAKVGYPVEYSVTVWEGFNYPNLVFSEGVTNYNVESWTEYSPMQQHVINSNNDLWVGLWVENQPANMYPAGVDDGPAITGYGDLISLDDGDTWDNLSDLGLDYNWNLQVYVTNSKGEEKQLIINNSNNREDKYLQKQTVPGNKIVSEKKQSNLDR